MGSMDSGFAKKLVASGNTLPQTVSAGVDSAIGGHRIVRYEAGSLVYADHTDVTDAPALLGLTLHAADPGNTVQIMLQGIVEESSWTWTPDLALYLGAAGVLTQVIPTTGFVIMVGMALSATKIYFNVKLPIILEV